VYSLIWNIPSIRDFAERRNIPSQPGFAAMPAC
jgi:hypothetical protein